MADDRLKSAYELAMERFQKKDAEAGIVQKPLTGGQKAAIAELRSRYQAKIAELEILHRGNTTAIVDPLARETAEDEYRRERERLNAERESKIDAVRRGE
jgi:hypothetical protein